MAKIPGQQKNVSYFVWMLQVIPLGKEKWNKTLYSHVMCGRLKNMNPKKYSALSCSLTYISNFIVIVLQKNTYLILDHFWISPAQIWLYPKSPHCLVWSPSTLVHWCCFVPCWWWPFCTIVSVFILLIRYKLNLNIAATMLIIVWRTDLQEWTGVIIVLCCKSLSNSLT